ncbi:MAG: AAA family ATPase, partial [Clostridium sp.]|nr:AAA family ATPase [Clostridium sp.]
MARVVSIGAQNFEKVITNNYFYVDKTAFIKEWWESGDEVTLITRPRRFGKTLNMNMLDRFWNVKYQGQGEIFEGLDIWKEEKYRKLQGTYPVIFLTFADVKEDTYDEVRNQIIQILTDLYSAYYFLRDCGKLNEKDKEYFDRVGKDMSDSDAAKALHKLSDYLYRYYGKKVLILLDEYDTPMQEAYVNGYWKELTSFTRSLFNSTFKTNPYLERAIMTGITRVSKESMFSDLNNLNVVTTTSEEYAVYFGFTEAEVFTSMEEFGLTDKEGVKRWYDGFTFGSVTDIYNPWSIINYLNKKKFGAYWANTSSNSLAGSLLQKGNKHIKMQFEQLLHGESIICSVDEEIVYN